MTVSTHTLSVLVEDKPGVLARVASLFSRRGFNIQSLAVGATEQKDMSRMTIVVSVEDSPLEQITKQLNKLINVIKIVEQDENNAVARELALCGGQAVVDRNLGGVRGRLRGLRDADPSEPYPPPDALPDPPTLVSTLRRRWRRRSRLRRRDD